MRDYCKRFAKTKPRTPERAKIIKDAMKAFNISKSDFERYAFSYTSCNLENRFLGEYPTSQDIGSIFKNTRGDDTVIPYVEDVATNKAPVYETDSGECFAIVLVKKIVPCRNLTKTKQERNPLSSKKLRFSDPKGER